MGGNRKGWYERIDVKRINKDWVDINCKLTEREIKILQLVYYRKMVRRDHLEILHDGYRNIAKRSNSLNKSINKLFNNMCLDKAQEEQEFKKGNKPCVLSVDRAGCIILCKPYKQRFDINKRFLNNREYVFRKIPAHYNHIHGVNKLEIDTLEFCLEHGDKYQKVIWQLEEDNLKVFEFNQIKYVLKPDVFVVLNINGKPLIYFIEYDTGSENIGYINSFPTILQKLEKYQKYKMIGEWQNEWWAKKMKTTFPPLLFITKDEKRLDFINKKGKALGLNITSLLPAQYKATLNSY